MAAIERAVLARRGAKRRRAEAPTWAREGAAWEERRHRHQASSDGRGTVAEARLPRQSRFPKDSGSQTTSTSVWGAMPVRSQASRLLTPLHPTIEY
jgi:hypothetical protein